MADKERERERVLYQGEPATVLERHSRRITIRTGHGYEVTVSNKDVEAMPKGDDRRTFKFRE